MPQHVSILPDAQTDVINSAAIDGTTNVLTINSAIMDLPTAPSQGHPCYRFEYPSGTWQPTFVIPDGATLTASFNSGGYTQAALPWILGHPQRPT